MVLVPWELMLFWGMGVELKGKILLEWLLGSEMTAGCHYRNGILCIYCFRLTALDVSQWCSGWHVRMSIQLSRIVSGKGEYDFLFNDDMVNLLWKKLYGKRQNTSFCYLCCLDCSSCRQVGDGGLGQKVLFRASWNLISCVPGLIQGRRGGGGEEHKRT